HSTEAASRAALRGVLGCPRLWHSRCGWRAEEVGMRQRTSAASLSCSWISAAVFLALCGLAGCISGLESSSSSDVAALRPADIVADWKFDEGLGTTANDSSGNRHTGTVVGPTWTSGKSGGALLFNGSSGYVQVADFDPPTSGLTYEAWIYLTAAPTAD